MHGEKQLKIQKDLNTPYSPERPLSLMSDRRIVRGNTYSGAPIAGGHAKVSALFLLVIVDYLVCIFLVK